MDDEKQVDKKPNRVPDNDGLHKRRGVWHFKLKVGGKWKEFSTHTKNYHEARARRHAAIEAQNQGRLPGDKGKVLFEKAMEAWLKVRANQMLAENTLRIDRERSGPLLAAFSGRRLNSFTADDIKAYQATRSKLVSPKTIDLEIGVLRGILKDGRCWAPIAEDYKPLRRSKQGPGVALTLDEERLFETARSKPGWEVAYFAALLAANTTMRGCEGSALGQYRPL
jgi:hypothetical protein